MLAFGLYHYPRSPIILGTYAVVVCFISWDAARSFPADMSGFAQAIVMLFVAATGSLIYTGVLAMVFVLGMLSRRNQTFLTEHAITVGAAFFVEETPYNRTEYNWLAVQKLARTKRYLFIYISQNAAHVIPRRAFASDADWQAFYAVCQQATEPLVKSKRRPGRVSHPGNIE